MNRVMTVGLDQRWRRLAVRLVVWPGDRVLDACCGTGDLAIAARSAGARGRRASTSPARCSSGARRKATSIEWIQGDLLALPFEDASFDAATVGFGVRNVADLERGLAELRRVLRPGGRLAILEITRPRGLLRAVLPALVRRPRSRSPGKILPGGKAYTYLPASVRRFPGPGELADADEAHGVRRRRYRRLAGGIVALHTGTAAMTRSRQSAAPGLEPYLEQVETRLAARVAAYPGLVAEVGADALAAGGKRLRPLLASSRAPPAASAPPSRRASRSSSSTWRRSSTTT